MGPWALGAPGGSSSLKGPWRPRRDPMAGAFRALAGIPRAPGEPPGLRGPLAPGAWAPAIRMGDLWGSRGPPWGHGLPGIRAPRDSRAPGQGSEGPQGPAARGLRTPGLLGGHPDPQDSEPLGTPTLGAWGAVGPGSFLTRPSRAPRACEDSPYVRGRTFFLKIKPH